MCQNRAHAQQLCPLAAIPTGPVAVPLRVRELTGGRALVPVWVNGLGGSTFHDPDSRPSPGFIKWVPAGTPELDLEAEAERLAWADEHGALVPRVLASGADESGSWLITAALAGESAVAPRWIAEPVTAARAIGAGLRILHDTLPVAECPYSWSAAERIEQFEQRLRTGSGPSEWDPAHRHLTLADARARLADIPDLAHPVVCHGDACAPNTLLDATGRFTAHVDLGTLGVADPWADLAIAAWSTEWNYGTGFEDLVYEGYGIEPDPARISYYRLLWDLS
ncbi:aminoglycoside 3'-phosphotransferase [Leucobacter luti]|uniref:aminoglycoside 3'-phosphotransferase n=1 Tax=Leucobacter luti TaxID=340320 RepID=UPI001FB31BB5|nr:aminoglycoside 3'-phosphotransferase [Leucobacter luti]MCW2287592.1 kanamycin kinase [Leucobacter luti]